jgi:NAD(P)-dependent dehydrogenase (short-subunit alcohol dehydrogenase family)
MMTRTLITGGNRGIGFETARRLVDAGHDVWIGARSADSGQQAADRLRARFVELDVTRDESVDAAATRIQEEAGSLDVLINNAGILGPTTGAGELTAEDIREVYETNVFGLVRVTHAFLPLLRAGRNPSVCNVTSGVGSFTLTQDPRRIEFQYPLAAYGSSKSAVTMLTLQYARTVPEVRFNAVDPGQTATEFTGNHGGPVEDGAEPIVRMATLGDATPTGTVTDRDGVLPW